MSKHILCITSKYDYNYITFTQCFHSLSVSMGSRLSRLICRQWFLRVPGGTGDEGFTGKRRGRWVCWFINMHWGLKAGDHLWKCCSLHFPLSLFFVVILSTWVKVLIEKNYNILMSFCFNESTWAVNKHFLWRFVNVIKCKQEPLTFFKKSSHFQCHKRIYEHYWLNNFFIFNILYILFVTILIIS